MTVNTYLALSRFISSSMTVNTYSGHNWNYFLQYDCEFLLWDYFHQYDCEYLNNWEYFHQYDCEYLVIT